MNRKLKKKKTRLLAAMMCTCSASLMLVHALKNANFEGSAKESAGSYSDTLYMSLQSGNTASSASDIDFAVSGEKEASENKIQNAGNSSSTTHESAVAAGNFYDYSEIKTVRLLYHEENKTEELSLEDYVAAVVAAEMPANASAEALKAQAVACRTLAVSLILTEDKSAHAGADICTNSAHCQSFVTKDEYVEKYGDAGAKCFENAKNAAKATKGIILLYNSKPIVAAFHASSGEYTASSYEVWGGSVDYLVSVKTGESEKESLKSQVFESKSFTKEQFIRKLENAGAADLSRYEALAFHEWVSGITRTASGRVDFIRIGDRNVSGNTIKNIFGLKSTDFSISYTDDVITFSTKGYGHGVGMSQLGAVAMAEDGSTFYEILKYYYPGVSFGIVGD